MFTEQGWDLKLDERVDEVEVMGDGHSHRCVCCCLVHCSEEGSGAVELIFNPNCQLLLAAIPRPLQKIPVVAQIFVEKPVTISKSI